MFNDNLVAVEQHSSTGARKSGGEWDDEHLE